MAAPREVMADPRCATLGVYTAGPSGFFDAGLLWHNTVLVPALEAAGLLVLDPWADQSALAEILSTMPFGAERKAALEQANLVQGRLDLAMVDACAVVLACLDGPVVDDGTAIEIGYAHKAGKVILGLRTDIRIASDNEGSRVNLMIETCVVDSGGLMTASVDEAVSFLAQHFHP
jgi:nucleoside 2-deoxyribosyltransferase